MARSFETTSWSVVLSARGSDGEASRAALDALCRVYWPPLYAHVRRRGYSAEDAQDLTQGFFCRLFERDFLGHVDRERGRFRTLLLSPLDRFLVEEWEHRNAKRRGGGRVILTVDLAEAEERLLLQADPSLDPRRQYDRQWAETLLLTVMARLAQEYADTGKTALFEALRPCLSAQRNTLPYRQLGEQLGLSEGALKVTVHRLRRRYALLLREEVARTVGDAADWRAELHYLFEAMGTSAGSGQ